MQNPDLLTTPEAAEYLGMSKDSLQQDRWRHTHKVPYVKLNRLVRYRRPDLDEWLAKKVVRPGEAA